MKKVYWFSIAAALTSVLLIIITAAGFYLFGFSNIFITPQTKNTVSGEVHLQESNTNDYSTELLAIFSQDERLYACLVNLDFSSNTVETSAVNLTADIERNPQISSNILKNDGIYCFVERCFSSIDKPCGKYILINSKNFRKITDKCHGIVYNYSEKESALLTGIQAESILSYDTFPDICRQLAEFALDGRETEFFSFLVSNTENNLSYPHMYDLTH